MRCYRTILLAIITLVMACSSNSTNLSNLKGSLDHADAVILHSLGESLSAVLKGNPRQIINNLSDESGTVLNTGTAPNQILIRNGLAYIINSRSNNLQVIHLNGLFTLAEVSLGQGANPYYMAFYGEDRLYVTNVLGSDNNGNVAMIKIHDDGSYERALEIEMPRGSDLEPFEESTFAKPQGIAVSNSKIYVTLTNMASWVPGGPGFVVVIDPIANTIIKKIKTSGLNPSTAYVCDFEPNRVYILHSGTFMGDGVIDIIDSSSDEIVQTIEIGGAPYSMTVTGDQKAYVSDALGPHLLSFSTNDFSILNGPENPIAVADPEAAPFNFVSYLDVNRDGFIWALAFNSDELYIIDPATKEIAEGPYLVGDGPISMVLDK